MKFQIEMEFINGKIAAVFPITQNHISTEPCAKKSDWLAKWIKEVEIMHKVAIQRLI